MPIKIDALMKDINKSAKAKILNKGLVRTKAQRIPFSSDRINYCTYGGLPRGRIHEFFGEENGGKTTTALDICANAAKIFEAEAKAASTDTDQVVEPKAILYLDCENSLDAEWADLLGVDVANMYILKPEYQSAEEIFEVTLNLIDSGDVGLVIIDSLGVMISGAELEKTVEEKTYGGISAALTKFSKKAVQLCQRTGCTLIGINQLRDNLNNPNDFAHTSGGRAWKFNCTCRLMFRKGSFINADGDELPRKADEPIGNRVMMSVQKTKLFPSDRRTGFYTLRYETGIDSAYDLIDLAVFKGIIIQKSAWYYYGTEKYQGFFNLYTAISNDATVFNKIKQDLQKFIKGDDEVVSAEITE